MSRPPWTRAVAAAAVGAALLAFAGGAAARPHADVSLQPIAQIVRAAADPTAVVLDDGRVRIYYAGGEGIVSAISSDGISFTPEPGNRTQVGVTGPHSRIFKLDDGRFRLFFSTSPRATVGGIGSAISDDGLDFVVEPGLRVSAEAAGLAPKTLSAGDVLELADGRYRMYFSSFTFSSRPPDTTHEVVKSAVSSNLLDWTVEPGIRVGGSTGITGSAEHPSAIRLADGSVALFYGRPLPFALYLSISKDGLTFDSETRVADKVLDSAVVTRPDGTRLMYYGSHDPATVTSFIHVGRLTLAAPSCVVPAVKGKTLAAARAAIGRAGCTVGKVTRVRSARASAGRIVSQRPAARVRAAQGRPVALVVGR